MFNGRKHLNAAAVIREKRIFFFFSLLMTGQLFCQDRAVEIPRGQVIEEIHNLFVELSSNTLVARENLESYFVPQAKIPSENFVQGEFLRSVLIEQYIAELDSIASLTPRAERIVQVNFRPFDYSELSWNGDRLAVTVKLEKRSTQLLTHVSNSAVISWGVIVEARLSKKSSSSWMIDEIVLAEPLNIEPMMLQLRTSETIDESADNNFVRAEHLLFASDASKQMLYLSLPSIEETGYVIHFQDSNESLSFCVSPESGYSDMSIIESSVPGKFYLAPKSQWRESIVTSWSTSLGMIEESNRGPWTSSINSGQVLFTLSKPLRPEASNSVVLGFGWDIATASKSKDHYSHRESFIDPDQATYLRIIDWFNYFENWKLSGPAMKVGVSRFSRKSTINLAMNSFVDAVWYTRGELQNGAESTLVSGYYPDLFGVTISDSRVYDFGTYNSQTEYDFSPNEVNFKFGIGLEAAVPLGIAREICWNESSIGENEFSKHLVMGVTFNLQSALPYLTKGIDLSNPEAIAPLSNTILSPRAFIPMWGFSMAIQIEGHG